ncbi:MAG: HEAT repeat domain-containing protein [Candidatus Eremiobacteraeota bacterium]|nr:HEAT repeat domain-containing protein [Candidatus Eremiobacteraeota bacterium]
MHSIFKKQRLQAIWEMEALTFKFAAPALMKDEIDSSKRDTYKIVADTSPAPDISQSVYDELVAVFIKATASSDYDTVDCAVLALGISKARASIPTLMALFNARTSPQKVMKALGQIGPDAKAALPMVRKEASTNGNFARVAAIEALAAIGRMDAISDLVKYAQDADEDVRQQAVSQIGNLYDGGKEPVPDQVIDILIASLKDTRDRQSVRIDAAYALAKIGPRGKRAVPGLTALTKDSYLYCRKAAAYALGCVAPKDPAVRAALKAIKGDPDAEVRKKVQEALEKGNR